MTPAGGLTSPLGGGVYLVDLPQGLPGFHHFISSWFFLDASGRRVVVDPGPESTIPLLNGELEKLTDGVDLVLITHIHLDHSGGIGTFCRRWPEASVLVHPRGARHLREPRKLWSASVKTLGDVALAYGEPTPLTAPLLDEDPGGVAEVFQTPGHAPHHISIRIPTKEGETLFFLGEAAGMTVPTLDGGLWLRPTTPPKFDGKAALASLDLLARTLRGDERLCYAHWGSPEGQDAAGGPLKRVAMAREQMERWLEEIRTMTDRPPEEIVEHFLRCDPLLQAKLDDDLPARERVFMSNSVRGILGFLAEGQQGACASSRDKEAAS